ncbi:hypothetical protein Tco_0666225 [Tanacetum coccineum]
MDLETAQITTTAKFPTLKQENGNSFKPAAKTTTNTDGTSTTLIPGFRRLSLPSEWNTHVVVWRNKPNLDTMSFDDLYNNFMIVEQEVKGTTSLSSQNMTFVSSPSSTNEVNTANGVSTANTQVSLVSTQVSTTSTQVSTANLSDDTVYAFLARGFSRKMVERSLSMRVTQLDMTSPRWSVSTATIWDTLQGNAEDLGTKIAETGIKTALEGL